VWTEEVAVSHQQGAARTTQNISRKHQSIASRETSPDGAPLAQALRSVASRPVGTFVLKQTIEMQMDPHPAKLMSLIEINCNIPAGLSGRA
jgi:hypothetical protein